MMKYVYMFDDVSNPELEAESGKGANCAKLLQAYRKDGFEPAPNGFRVTKEAYRLHIDSNRLTLKLEVVLDEFEQRKINLDVAAARCQKIIMDAPMPPIVKDQIIEANQLMEEMYGIDFMRIPRSDCTIGEDEAGEAGAGRHESFRGRTSQSDTIHHIKKVWASQFTDKAIAAFNGRKDASGNHLILSADMRVPVLREIDSRKGGSFILFTTVFNTATVTFLPLAHGEDLVSGGKTPNTLQVSLSLVEKGLNPIIGFDIPSQNLGLTYNELIQYLIRINRRHKISGPIDNEAAMDGEIYTVQERPNTPHLKKIHAKEIEIHEVQRLPSSGLISNGVSVADLCANGFALYISVEQIKKLDQIDLQGKIVITDFASPELSILTSLPEDKRPAGLICRQGTILCHMAINIDDNIPCIVGCTDLPFIKNGEEVSVLHNKVYLGCHPFTVEYLRISDLPAISGKVQAGLVACNPSKVEKYHILTNTRYNLVRMEGLQQATIVNGSPLPPILSCIHWNKIADQELLKNVLNLMRVPTDLGFGFGSPIDAYIHYFSRSLIPLLEDAKLKSGDLDLRAYGGRLTEDDPLLEKGFIPEEAYDSIGCDGTLMYLQDWGRPVLDVYCKIWKEVWNMGYTNMPLFFPNVATLDEWLFIKQVCEENRIPIDRDKRFGDYKVKIMLETPSSLFLVNLFYENGVDEGSLGFNDLRQGFYLFKRDFAFVKSRGNSDSYEFLALMNYFFDIKPKHFKVHTCGVPSRELIKLLVKRGVASIGFGPGKKFFEGVKLLAETEKELTTSYEPLLDPEACFGSH
jgi:pyruvate, water dikinase